MTPYRLAKAAQIVVVVVVTKQYSVEALVLLSVGDLVQLPLVVQPKHPQVSQIQPHLPRLLRCPQPLTKTVWKIILKYLSGYINIATYK